MSFIILMGFGNDDYAASGSAQTYYAHTDNFYGRSMQKFHYPHAESGGNVAAAFNFHFPGEEKGVRRAAAELIPLHSSLRPSFLPSTKIPPFFRKWYYEQSAFGGDRRREGGQ